MGILGLVIWYHFLFFEFILQELNNNKNDTLVKQVAHTCNLTLGSQDGASFESQEFETSMSNEVTPCL